MKWDWISITRVVERKLLRSGVMVLGSALFSMQTLAQPPAPSISAVTATQNGLSQVTVVTPGGGTRKLQLTVERSSAGANDWSHPSNEFPYYSDIVVATAATEVVDIGSGSFQGNYDYRARARQWQDGDGGNPSSWSAWSNFSVGGSATKPTPPYPMLPTGALSGQGIILRADDSALPAPGFSTVSQYRFEIKTAHNPFDSVLDTPTRWTVDVAAPGSGNVAEASVSACQNIVGCSNGVLPESADYSFRWRVRAMHDALLSDWSRWRYFTTANQSTDLWYIRNRAGSYQAGSASGDEASGLVASKNHPGIFWFIRDAGEPEDRRRLYAIRIDPATGRLGNVDGYITKQITINGADNIDWEAIAVDDSGNLWIGDIGDYYRKPGLDGQFWDRNNSAEPDVHLFRVPEPDPDTADSATVTKVAPFEYPDGNTYNAESLFWMDGWMFLITKSENNAQHVYRFPSYISRTQNVLRSVGSLPLWLDPITDASITEDNTRLAITTAARRALVYAGTPTNAQTSSEAEDVVRDLFVNQDPTWEYYYREAAGLAVDGLLEQERQGYPVGSPEREETMQVEGVAWDLNQGNLAMISEYGKHVLYAPAFSANDYGGWQNRLLGAGGVALGNSAPVRPTLISPTGSSATGNPQYQWNAVADASWYRLWVDDDTGTPIKKWYTAEAANCAFGLGSCSVMPASAVTGTVRWWIQAWNHSGTGPWSSSLSFSVGASLPAKAVLISPSGPTNSNTPTYRWNAVADSTWYYLWVNDSTGTPIKKWYTAAQVGCSGVSGVCEITPATAVSGNATWWIRTWNSAGSGPWSAGMQFQ